MRCFVLGAALLICGSQAHAVFVSATSGTPGVDLQQSFARLQADARFGGDEQVLNPLPIPYTGQMQAQYAPAGDDAYAYAAETYNLGANLLQVDVTRLDRNGPSSVFSNGAWIFSVTETVRATATGTLNKQPSGYTTEKHLRATFDDLTTGVRLFESIQWDAGTGGTVYHLGGLVGLRAASFTGQLENVLFAGHTYRLLYTMGVQGPNAGTDSSQASGRISLLATPVPEPATWLTLLIGFCSLTAVLAGRTSTVRCGGNFVDLQRRCASYIQ